FVCHVESPFSPGADTGAGASCSCPGAAAAHPRAPPGYRSAKPTGRSALSRPSGADILRARSRRKHDRMRRKLVAGNWRFHLTRASAADLVHAIAATPAQGFDVAVSPPFVYVAEVAVLCRGRGVAVGAQDVSAFAQGAYTGEVAASMLVDAGAT